MPHTDHRNDPNADRIAGIAVDHDPMAFVSMAPMSNFYHHPNSGLAYCSRLVKPMTKQTTFLGKSPTAVALSKQTSFLGTIHGGLHNPGGVSIMQVESMDSQSMEDALSQIQILHPIGNSVVQHQQPKKCVRRCKDKDQLMLPPLCQKSFIPTNATNLNQQTVHNGYRGFDLKMQYNVETDSSVVFCETYTHGSFEVFVMVNSTIPTILLPKQRFTLPKDGLPTFIRSSCMTNFKQSGRGSLIAYSYKYQPEWKIGIVNAFRYDLELVSTIELWEFRDVVDEKGVPTILKCELWEVMLPLLRHRAFFLDDIELMFLNQVSNT